MMHSRPDNFLYATDDKLGYWQLAMHPDAFRFRALQGQRTLFHFPACAFGLAPACGWYSDMKLEVYRAMRERRARLIFLIDDHAAEATGPQRANYLCRTVVMILSDLGLSGNKTIQYQTDSQSAWTCLLRQKGAKYWVRDILVDST
ncbi:hypothetical protein Vretifemale_7423, partial [Volvox reticuliferus]